MFPARTLIFLILFRLCRSREGDINNECFLLQTSALRSFTKTRELDGLPGLDSDIEPVESGTLLVSVDAVWYPYTREEEVPSAFPFLFLAFFGAYTTYCIWYQICVVDTCSSVGQEVTSKSERDGKVQWAEKEELGSDTLNCVQFIATFFIIGRHFCSFLNFPNEIGWRAWPNAFVMPAFAFAVGVCGEGTPTAVVWRTKVATAIASVAALAVHVVAIVLFSESPFSARRIFLDRAMFYWFLLSVVIWRMFVTPTFAAAKRFGIPLMIPFSLLYVACYFGRHFFNSIWDKTASVPGVYVWNRLFAFAPFFATGNLLPGRRVAQDDRRLAVSGCRCPLLHSVARVAGRESGQYELVRCGLSARPFLRVSCQFWSLSI